MEIPENLKNIGNYVFSGCSDLGEIKIPEGVESIGKEAFYECINLAEIEISEGVTSIEEYTFYSCTSLGSVSIPESVTTIQEGAFNWCDEIKYFVYNGTKIGWENISKEDTGIDENNVKVYYKKEIHEHTYKTVILKTATCMNTGEQELICDVCGEKIIEKIPVAGHKFSPWRVISSANIDYAEKQSRLCDVCGTIEQREVGEKLQPTMTLTTSILILTVGEKTNVLKVLGIAEGDIIISWKSDNTDIAQVLGKIDGSCSVVAGNKAGKTKITITLKSNLKKTVNVIVRKKTVKTKKISGIAKKMTLKRRHKLILHPIITPLSSTEKITYKSSKPKVVAVNSKGRILAKKKGKAVITVKSGKKKVKCKVTVK